MELDPPDMPELPPDEPDEPVELAPLEPLDPPEVPPPPCCPQPASAKPIAAAIKNAFDVFVSFFMSSPFIALRVEIYLALEPLEPPAPDVPDEPELPELPELCVLSGLPAPAPPEVWSVARRSQPANDMASAATTSKIFDVLTSDFIVVPFIKFAALVLDHFICDKFLNHFTNQAPNPKADSMPAAFKGFLWCQAGFFDSLKGHFDLCGVKITAAA